MNEVSSGFVPKDVWSHLDSFFEEMQELGVVYIDHGVIDDAGKYTGYFSHKEWGKIYIEERLFLEEPIFWKKPKQKSYFLPWESKVGTNHIFLKRLNFTHTSKGLTLFFEENSLRTFCNIGIETHRNFSEFVFFNNEMLDKLLYVMNSYHLRWRKKHAH